MNPLIDARLKEIMESRIGDIHPCFSNYPEKKWINICDCYYMRHDKRWIQVFTTLSTQDIHYEYYGGYACLHIEQKYAERRFMRHVRELKRRSSKHHDIKWLARTHDCISCIINDRVDGEEDLIKKLRRLAGIFDKDLNEIFGHDDQDLIELNSRYTMPSECDTKLQDNDEVSIHTLSIDKLFGLPLSIPSYQRIYCWKDIQIESLWHSLNSIKNESPYHLGAIILQHRCGKYEIVDGQQRLVTLSLILWRLGYTGPIPLLNERFRNCDAIKHIKNAKAVITALSLSLKNNRLKESIVKSLRFSVIIINGENMDLGYTFFSNQNSNSKRVKLTDYDLLKAHHLRYVVSRTQAIHLANSWIRLTHRDNEDSPMPVERSLGKHVYRMRKLLQKADFNEYGHYVRDEFKAAPTMPDVPPSGERFDFFEPIQGGLHFFAFASHFNDRYKTFALLPQVQKLNKEFSRHHKVYCDIAESILFAYYLKFGTQYLSEALFCIMKTLAMHRYTKARALEQQVHKYAQDSNLIQFIQFSSSPTFFLASAVGAIPTDMSDYYTDYGVRHDFYERSYNLFSSFDDVTVADIAQRIANDY